LNFRREVDPAIVEQSVSFEPELNFTVRSAQPGEIYLEPVVKWNGRTYVITDETVTEKGHLLGKL